MPHSLPSDARPENPAICIFYEYKSWPWLLPFEPERLKRILAAMLAVCADKGAEIESLELYLVDDATAMRENRRCMASFGPTNVLSFPAASRAPAMILLSLDACEREKKLYGQQAGFYFLELLAHAFGHLAGFDHSAEHAALSERCMDAGFLESGFTR